MNSKKNIIVQLNNIILCDGSIVPKYEANVTSACSLEKVNFAYPDQVVEKVNTGVAQKTNGLITKLLNNSDISSLTKMIILNTLYLKGSWSIPFKTVRENCPFINHLAQTKVVSMMSVTDNFKYFEDDYCKILEMWYQDKETMFGIILPKKISVDKINLDMYLNKTKLSYEKVRVTIPQFEQRYRTDFTENLKSQGLILAFDNNLADFSSMSTEKIFIDKVIQETVVKID